MRINMGHGANSILMVIVHYGEVNPTRDLLESLRKLHGLSNLDVVIVNNDLRAQIRRTLSAMAAPIANVTLLDLSENRGYFGGAKLAISSYVAERRELPVWVIVSNNDILIRDQFFLHKLMNRDSRRAAVIAPRIISTATQCDQNPFMRRRPGRLRVAELRFWLTNFHLACFHERLSLYKNALRSWISSGLTDPMVSRKLVAEPIYAPHGSFIIFSHRFFDFGGHIDDGVFMYAEEVSVAETCRRIGAPAVYEPELMVFHQEHCARGQKLSRKTYQRQKEGLDYLVERYLDGPFVFPYRARLGSSS